MRIFQVNLPEPIRKRLDARAARCDLTRGEIVRRALEYYLDDMDITESGDDGRDKPPVAKFRKAG